MRRPSYRMLGMTGAVLGGMGAALAWQSTLQAEPRAELSGPGGQRVVVAIEIADTMEARTYGLMNRASLGADAGMLFVWPEPTIVSFWMRDTLIPLDMLFFRNGELVMVELQVQPHDETPRGPDVPVDMVLEVNGGFAAAKGIAPGWRVSVARK